MVEFIAFDADDTLWHNETYFSEAQERFKLMMQEYQGGEYSGKHLYETEIRNLKHYGYGVKSFGLSMIESAIELTHGRISAADVGVLIELTKEMLNAPVHLLPEVRAVLDELSGDYPLMVITKGDLLDQKQKFNRSGLAEYFRTVEVVNEKDRHTYCEILHRYRIRPEEFLMVGNSLRSDVLPVIEIGGQAIHIPYHQTWEHERVLLEGLQPRSFVQLEGIGQLPQWLESKLLAA